MLVFTSLLDLYNISFHLQLTLLKTSVHLVTLEREMAIARFGRQVKRSYGFCLKMTAVTILGMCFVFIWSIFSSTSVTNQRSSFGEIAEPVSANGKITESVIYSTKKDPENRVTEEDKKGKFESDLKKDKKKVNGSIPFMSTNRHRNWKDATDGKKNRENIKLPKEIDKEKNHGSDRSGGEELQKEKEEEEEEVEVENKEEERDGNGNEMEGDANDLISTTDESDEPESKGKKKKNTGPLFDSKAHYNWKLCSTRSKHNYIPCIDIESASGRLKLYRHHERSCPKMPPMCLVPLPTEGYGTPVRWPESKSKVRGFNSFLAFANRFLNW